MVSGKNIYPPSISARLVRSLLFGSLELSRPEKAELQLKIPLQGSRLVGVGYETAFGGLQRPDNETPETLRFCVVDLF